MPAHPASSQKGTRRATVCPHDCPSTCALEVEITPKGELGRVYGRKDNAYTAGVICAKVARYAERLHHPDRLTHPLRRNGSKGSGAFTRISWEEALAEISERFLAAEQRYGAQTVWPYYFAGTMGLVQRDSINRLRHAKGYSGMYQTFCTNMAWTGYIAGTGRLAGPDPKEMALSDCVVIWGTNPVATQVNVMPHAIKARKTRGAKIVVIDVYDTPTAQQADMKLILRPGTDGALACAVMHILFRDGNADRSYMDKYADCPQELEAHLSSKTPEWAAQITDLSVEQIEEFAALVGTTQRTFFRLGYGFTRQRNGVINMHAASCIAVVGGHYQYKGGGAFHNNGAIYGLNTARVEARELADRSIRQLDMSQIGRVLTGDPAALHNGPPVTALLVQNSNPASVAPEQTLVQQGLAREDLFTVVHEHFLTETARFADIVLPATMFTEHDDIYKTGGAASLHFGPKLMQAPGEARENLWLLNELIRRLGGTDHKGHHMSAREHVEWMLENSGYGPLTELEKNGFVDCQPEFDRAHYLDGFGYRDKKFRFAPDWSKVPAPNAGPMGPWQHMPRLPDHWPVNEATSGDTPFKLVTAPARSFLNSSFNETQGSRKKEGRPCVLIPARDAQRLGIEEGDPVALSNHRGRVELHARIADTEQQPGILVSEGLWPNADFINGRGINTLTGADQTAPYGGAAFHDIAVRLEPLLNRTGTRTD
ncbi:molybdopterin-containing oxidoreductase family protein [Polycladidibacter hongkongensis]|uniref:molybdopterin-containing oxidoreductase family protein n=1 Tax=Polycladidibacter hongkongensis TaxID=1647556 RepID=UPI000834A9C8|nr:molybdopterin-dependent oxidoreductase [Pseudovibrio hongkongensis]